MLGIVNNAQKESAKKILEGDFSKMGFFLNTDEADLEESEKHEIALERAEKFLGR